MTSAHFERLYGKEEDFHKIVLLFSINVYILIFCRSDICVSTQLLTKNRSPMNNDTRMLARGKPFLIVCPDYHLFMKKGVTLPNPTINSIFFSR